MPRTNGVLVVQSGRRRGYTERTHCVIALPTREFAVPFRKGVHPRAFGPGAPTPPSSEHLTLRITRSRHLRDAVATCGLTSAKLAELQRGLRNNAHAIALARRNAER
ncbi:hypothetical protein J7T55_003040 [Diaporthe amygdali]|uniref:uncharacterized protein n=1 Tax=Phomopsis amygdali TaxID=1214568 RepID=UPI0022FE6F7E|nr:uncharacterized protein J7T55_003040 [Diaporthe amygdali]KAJ0122527.1 hypothetical protein J7T55_003040 [Diaporthe amygdali]